MKLTNKVVIITGSSQGIGKTTARLMLEQGASVVLNGRNVQRLEASAMELSALGPVLAIPGDMSHWPDVQAMIQSTLDRFGRIDAIVCNAGIKFEDSFWRTSPETLQKIMDVNLLGQVFPIKAGLKALQKSRGSVILISSLAGLYGLAGASIYSASKMGLTAIQQGLSQELAHDGIHTGVMYVGFTENDPSSGILNGEGQLEAFPDRKLKRQAQAVVGQAIIHMILHRKKRKVMTGMGIAMDVMGRVAPGLLRMILAKQSRAVAASAREVRELDSSAVLV
ncbi:MAG: SDR family NAD(P)-dependent oxidoreductase [Bacteroidota bacterium]